MTQIANIGVSETTVNAEKNHGPKLRASCLEHRSQFAALEQPRALGVTRLADDLATGPAEGLPIPHRLVDQALIVGVLEQRADPLNLVAQRHWPSGFRQLERRASKSSGAKSVNSRDFPKTSITRSQEAWWS